MRCWVKRFTPEFVRREDRFAKFAGRSWKVDETDVKVCGKWAYLYRAVDRVDASHPQRSVRPRTGCTSKIPLRPLSRRQSFQHDDAMVNTPLFLTPVICTTAIGMFP
uniref:DDE-type integrase/transposase/recombinase n=1 Tax=Paraburkholderia caffeinilytica TaxID=1761016 RepID=UPI0038B9D932